MRVVFSYHGGNWAYASKEFDFQPERAVLYRGVGDRQKLKPKNDQVLIYVSAREFRRLFPEVPIKHTSKAAQKRYGQ